VTKLSLDEIRKQGHASTYTLLENEAMLEQGKLDLTATLEKLRARRAFYRRQLNAAHTFKRATGADYADLIDRMNEYAEIERDLGRTIAYLEQIAEALDAEPGQ
jgi:hypothetical protein